ncbi:MAG: hypothetical protein JST92_21640, partial [Deltaproteobacteria bacterium]|nr:hypothetical protein [Deltaproteobacteria bacterium]
PELKRCRLAHEQRVLGGQSLSIAFAATQDTTGGDAKTANLRSMMAWLSFGTSLGGNLSQLTHQSCGEKGCAVVHDPWAQLFLSARASRDLVLNRNELAAGARLRLGNDSAGFSLDAAWTPYRTNAEGHLDSAAFAAILEARINTSTWLVGHVGGKLGSDATGGPLFGGLSLKLGSSPGPTLAPVSQ